MLTGLAVVLVLPSMAWDVQVALLRSVLTEESDQDTLLFAMVVMEQLHLDAITLSFSVKVPSLACSFVLKPVAGTSTCKARGMTCV